MKRYSLYKTVLFISALLLSQNGFCAKMDLFVSTATKAVAYTKLNFATTPVDKNFYLAQSSFGISLLNYIPSSDLDTSIDIGIVLNAVSAPLYITAADLPYAQTTGLYANTNYTPFVSQAYVRVKTLFNKDITLTAGKQQYMLGSGLILDDNGLGLIGISIEYESGFQNITAKLFGFQPALNVIEPAKEASLIGACIQIPTNGFWQLYAMRQIQLPQTQFTVISLPADRITKDFIGISYSLKTGQMLFEGEAVMQKGYARQISTPVEKINYDGNAFLLKGTWMQKFNKLGTGSAHIAYGRATGDNTDTLDTDEAFFPSYGRRYSGLERKGFGEVFAATLYDAWGGDSSTATGLPAGLSGIQMANAGVQFPPYMNFYAAIDFFLFQADKAPANKKLGTEFNAKLYYLLADTLKIVLSYGIFSPGDAYPKNTPSPSKLSLEISAKF